MKVIENFETFRESTNTAPLINGSGVMITESWGAAGIQLWTD
jgi:hypothetical protein